MALVHGCPKMTPVFTGRVYSPWTRVSFWTLVNTACEHGPWTRASFWDIHELGPSRSAGAIVNDVIIIFHLQDGRPKWHPCSRYGPWTHSRWTRPLKTGSVYRPEVACWRGYGRVFKSRAAFLKREMQAVGHETSESNTTFVVTDTVLWDISQLRVQTRVTWIVPSVTNTRNRYVLECAQ